ncbi:protein singed-like [Limulus polyphemus]|uniref:Fascin n=1 Tax=Limulus polyphemus TaxID=6850 RepID=A0ABM1SIN4_LIMPO|nr:protein singed-like [Limulus polyphemus]XP_022243490.1 protein singed-like [Limulus polyphemus]
MMNRNGHRTDDDQVLPWTIGLVNSQFRYLTAENFGCKINANGIGLKKKQTWNLEWMEDGEAVSLRSHQGKYLAVDQFGNVTCEIEDKGAEATFQIFVADDRDGKWALQSLVRGYFLGASKDKVVCTAKIPGPAELWDVHLATRPQVLLRSFGRRRFARLLSNMNEIRFDANIPWGEDTLFTLIYDSGKYSLHTGDGRCLHADGKLVDKVGQDCRFTLEFHNKYLALKAADGRYLAPVGSKAILRTRTHSISKDELFTLEVSQPQVAFAGVSGKMVSVRQGVDVTANQDEICDHETFQLEIDNSSKRWYVRTIENRYWCLGSNGGIQATDCNRIPSSSFDLVWNQNGSVSFLAYNGRFVAAKKNGQLFVNSDRVEKMENFYLFLVNRSRIVIRCDQGFVGYKSATSQKLECNKSEYETIVIEKGKEPGIYYLQDGKSKKYWRVFEDEIVVDSDVPQGFYLEIREPSKLSLKTSSGNYLVAKKNGILKVGDNNPESATLWEF